MLPGWTVAFLPHDIARNLYYVGSEDLASYLIVMPEGDILINSSLKESVPPIKQSVEQLGFHFNGIKILLISHAHYDHSEGSEMLLKMTGAKYYVTDADVTIESGGKEDFKYGRDRWAHLQAVKVDRVLHDGDKVELGGAVLVAHLTAGHTKETTTWTDGPNRGRQDPACSHRWQSECESSLQVGRERRSANRRRVQARF